jgi:23S rRNA pseudouridine1911/1915/1917 synthase
VQLDRPKPGARRKVENDELAMAVLKRQIEDQAIWRGCHCLDPRPAWDLDRGGRERMVGARANLFMGQSAGNGQDQRSKADDEHDAHHDDDDFQRSQLPDLDGAAKGSPVTTGELTAGGSVLISAEIAEDRMRLDRMLANHLPELSRTRLKRLIEEGRVVRDGAASCDPSQRVRPGQNFVVFFPETEGAAPAAQPLALDIRYEDAYLIVIDKPAGLVVHPAPGNPDGTLVNALIAHCGASLAGIGGVRRPGIVHRLDKDTSGLMVVAKTDAAHQALSRDFAMRRIDRAYAAFVWGVPRPATGEIAGNIGRSAVNRKKMAVVGEDRGRPALTRYRVERAFNRQAAFVECRLATGRTHQIRVHLAHAGHALIGDQAYGARAGRAVARSSEVGARIAAFPRQALHARRLGFVHPIEGGFLTFDSLLPYDLHELFIDLERF